MNLPAKPKLIAFGAAALVLAGGLALQFGVWPGKKQAAKGSASTAPSEPAAPPAAVASTDAGVAAQAHELKALESELKKKPGHGPILMRMAEVSRTAGRRQEAIGYLSQWAAAEPKNAEARLELGRALFEAGDINGALAETKASLAIKPDDPDALYNLGAIYGNINNDAEARNYWKRAAEIAPDSASGKRARESMGKLTLQK